MSWNEKGLFAEVSLSRCFSWKLNRLLVIYHPYFPLLNVRTLNKDERTSIIWPETAQAQRADDGWSPSQLLASSLSCYRRKPLDTHPVNRCSGKTIRGELSEETGVSPLKAGTDFFPTINEESRNISLSKRALERAKGETTRRGKEINELREIHGLHSEGRKSAV